MRSYAHVILYAAALCASAAIAHGPTPKKVSETIDIKADPKAVWAIAGDFAGISKWNPELKASEGSDKERTLTFKNGEKLKESVDENDKDKMTYSYRSGEANTKALPVSSYSATLTVTAKDGGSHVEWFGRFYRGDTGNEPAEDLNDEAGQKAMSGFFKAGLDGLKAQAEKKS